jgi:DNA polymerase I-like protein with 3'-5' exonuclease and polymerase domains
LSTKGSHLERAAGLPAIRPLLEMKRLEKLLSSFGATLKDKVRGQTSRVHASYNVAGAKSGRWTCSKPNLQQIPGDRLAAGFRSIFTASPGRILIGADYSQMEMRAAAEISGDEGLQQIYADGLDLHAITASLIAGVEPEDVTPAQRSGAKPVNFGSIYGMGAAGLAATAWNSYRINMTVAEAQRALDAFFREFPRLKRWMRDNHGRSQQSRRIDIGVGRVVESAWEPNGIRYTQSCNLPIQGTCADVMMCAVTRVHGRIHAENIDAEIVAQIHDEVILEADAHAAHAVAHILESEMIAAFSEMFPDAPVTNLVDVKMGATWADLK